MEGYSHYSPEQASKDTGRILYDNVQNSHPILRAAITEVYNRKTAAATARVNLNNF